jgi:type III secretory pathway component EscS
LLGIPFILWLVFSLLIWALVGEVLGFIQGRIQDLSIGGAKKIMAIHEMFLVSRVWLI